MKQAHFKKPTPETLSCYICEKKTTTEIIPIVEDPKTIINIPVCQFCKADIEEN
jgi:hypothetical protein